MFNNYIIGSVEFSHKFHIKKMLDVLQLFRSKHNCLFYFREWLIENYGSENIDAYLHSGYKTYWLDIDGNIKLGN